MGAVESIGAVIRRAFAEAKQLRSERWNAYLWKGVPEDVLWSDRVWGEWKDGTYDPDGPPEGLEAAMNYGGVYDATVSA